MAPTVASLLATFCVYVFSFGAHNAKSSSVIDCASVCQSQDGCLTFGFERGKRACCLHTADDYTDEREDTADRVIMSLWTYGIMSASSRYMEEPWSDHKWTVGKKCRIDTPTLRLHCDGVCPFPPGVNNAVVSSGGQETGRSRTYTCLDGYLDTSSFVTSGVSTCLPDNTWSPVNLTCSESRSMKVANATQSSIFRDGVPSRALDGKKAPDYYNLSCSHTDEERHPWLLLKLVGLSRVTGVELTNREDCCYERLSNFSIMVFTNKPTSSSLGGELCKHYTGTVGKAATELINCNSPIIGRYVKITLEQDSNTYLTVCEAVVKGGSLNKLLGKPTLQSSVVSSSSLSNKAIDGNKTTCSETLARSDGCAPWWQVDMGEVISVQKVYIRNRQDEKYALLRNLTITVHETFPSVCAEVTPDICMNYPGIIGRGRMVALACKRPIRGRYLKIQTGGNDIDGKAFLSLCVVSVNKPIQI